MKTKFIEIVVLNPGSRIFIAEATIASAKKQEEAAKIFRIPSNGDHGQYGRGNCGDRCDVGFG